jgi:CheY-like chemotaxis protein
MTEGKFYSSKDVCKICQISKSTLFKWEREGLITKVRRDWRGWRIYDQSNIDEIRKAIEEQKLDQDEGRSPTILVVDDDPIILKVMGELLKTAGYDVVTTPSGEDAIKIHEETLPALTFLDVKLKGEDGLEIFSRIREVDPKSKIIFLTGYPKLEDTVRVIKEGAYNYLAKPIKTEELLGMVREVMGEPQE